MLPRELIGFDRVGLNVRKRQFLSLAALVAVLISSGAIAPSAEAATKNKFLIASDIHFNPMADPALVADLAAADPRQWEPILQRSSPAGFSQYGLDTNWWLL